ncbi:hypothetical protein D3C72_2545900 [compost metagenome]
MVFSACHWPKLITMARLSSRMIAVRISVAMSDPTCSMPLLANTAGRAAKTASRKAQNCQD